MNLAEIFFNEVSIFGEARGPGKVGFCLVGGVGSVGGTKRWEEERVGGRRVNLGGSVPEQRGQWGMGVSVL